MAMLAGANVINHATGWLEGGLVTGFEKTVLDADLCGKVASFFEGVDLSANAFAMDAIREVGPGSHFLGCAHTQANFETAFYRSSIADNNSFEQWESEGAKDSYQRASGLCKTMLESYEAPAIDPAIDEALIAFIEQKKASMPDAFS
jgi:trimethylamine--corrinoid protein Co-methyltransferase